MVNWKRKPQTMSVIVGYQLSESLGPIPTKANPLAGGLEKVTQKQGPSFILAGLCESPLLRTPAHTSTSTYYLLYCTYPHQGKQLGIRSTCNHLSCVSFLFWFLICSFCFFSSFFSSFLGMLFYWHKNLEFLLHCFVQCYIPWSSVTACRSS